MYVYIYLYICIIYAFVPAFCVSQISVVTQRGSPDTLMYNSAKVDEVQLDCLTFFIVVDGLYIV